MRYLVTATMAASVLAIGLTMEPALSLPLVGKAASPDTAVLKVQQQGKEKTGPGQGGPAMGAPGKTGGGAMQQGGGKQLRTGEKGTQLRTGEKGTQLRTGQKGMRSEGGTRLRAEQGTRGGRAVEFGYRERGVRGERGRTGVYIERGRRHYRRPGGVVIERGYGYGPSCAWLRRRALETHSAYWWRRYRACRGL